MSFFGHEHDVSGPDAAVSGWVQISPGYAFCKAPYTVVANVWGYLAYGGRQSPGSYNTVQKKAMRDTSIK